MTPHDMLQTAFLFIALPVAAIVCVVAGLSGKVKVIGVTVGCCLAAAALMFASQSQWQQAGRSLASGILRMFGLS
jgi:peptidoglycan/LPS O-acetylase OafA/YrhL